MIKNFILTILDYITHIFPVKNNQVICSNFNGKKYDGNSKFMCELIKEKYPDLKIYCLGKNNEETDGVCYVKFPSIKALYIFSTSMVWISNVRLPIWIKKKKNQYYIQVWHGRASFKNIEELAGDSLDENYIKTAKEDSKKMDLLISPDIYDTELLKKCFWYDGKIIEYDLSYKTKEYFKKEKQRLREIVRKKYNIKKNEKILLYAPTFRKYDFDYNIELNNISKDYKLLIKLHPGIKKNNIINKNAINVSDYPSLDELLVASDVLISDYSSVVYDFLFYNEEVYLYAPDYDEYTNDRGFYIDYKNMPFSISYSMDSLEKAINNNKYKDYKKSLDKYLKDNGFNIDNTKNIDLIYKELDNVLKK